MLIEKSILLKQLDLDHLWHPYTEMGSYNEHQVLIERGKGPYVWDIDGNPYIDAISGLWNVQVGYGQSAIEEAVSEQVRELPFYPLNGRSHKPGVELAGQLAEVAPGELNRVFYATGGAEAVETAIKMSRQFWRQSGKPLRHKIIGLSRGWHGCTLGALAASGVAEERERYEPLAQGFLKIPAPDCYRCAYGQTYPGCGAECGWALEQAIIQEGPDTIAAFLAEPIMGLNGMVPPTQTFWDAIQEVCLKYDILLIIDEVAMGFGRTGKFFASEHYSLKPDILTCAKGITSGYLPLSAVITTDRVYNAFLGKGKGFIHGYTFGGHPVSCAAALANIRLLTEQKLPERALSLGAELVDFFKVELEDCPIVGDIRGVGLAIAIELVEDRESRVPLKLAGDLCNNLSQQGVLVRPLGWDHVLPLIPHLNIPTEVALKAAKLYVQEIRKLSNTRGSGVR